jgi:serine/threonine-protein kinase
LIIDPDGTLKVLDFGLSLISDDEDEFSLTMISGQNCIGTPDFIAPEQTIDSFTVDARADVYSLGCTLYYALTAAVPFAGESVREKLDAHRAGASLPLRQRRPELPAEIVDIVDRMMARDAGQRFDSAAAVEEAVRPFAKRYPVKFDFKSVLDSRCVLARQRVQDMVSKIGSQSSSTAEQIKRDPQLKDIIRMWPDLPDNVQRAIMALVDAPGE